VLLSCGTVKNMEEHEQFGNKLELVLIWNCSIL
jgi:hypothetical protein